MAHLKKTITVLYKFGSLHSSVDPSVLTVLVSNPMHIIYARYLQSNLYSICLSIVKRTKRGRV